MGKAVAALLICAALTGPAYCADGAGGVSPASAEKYQKAREQVAKLAGSRTASLAPDIAKQAGQSIELAQEGLKAGNDRQTREYSDMALLQSALAAAVADEKDAAEKRDAARNELEKVEKRLSDILAGKGEQP